METETPQTNEERGNEPREKVHAYLAAGILTLLAALGTVVFLDIKNPFFSPGRTVAATSVAKFIDANIEAKGALVFDIRNNTILFEKNSNAQLPLASLTKILLALVVAESLPLDTTVTLPQDMTSPRGALLARAGERWLVKDVLDMTLVESSNDGADILAQLAANRIRENFSNAPMENPTLWRMNELARALSLSQTYFLNVHGLDVSTTLAGSYGSARDMAILLAYAYEHTPHVFEATADGDVLLTSLSGTPVAARNTNEAEPRIAGLIMGKTGFTDLAGGNLAVVFDAGITQPVAVIVLGSTLQGRFTDVEVLVDKTRSLIAENQ